MSNSAMREALKEIDCLVWDKHRHTKEEVQAHRLATEALSAPRMNCEVGTAEEQRRRFYGFCYRQSLGSCSGCTFRGKFWNIIGCAIAWAQMPYTEGGADE